MRRFTADFETTTDENDCRVWAWALCEIGNTENFKCGNNIEDFINILKNKHENYILYFHNLKFDSEFLFSYLLKEGYECIKDKKQRRDKTFTTLIGSNSDFYSIEIYFDLDNKKRANKVTIYDSLKIIPFPVEDIPKNFGLTIEKLDLDYHEKREIGHELTEHEISYIRNDVEIMARVLETMFEEKLNKMTIASNALKNYKEINTHFNKYFPILPYEIDKDIRKSYRGGFTYLNDIYKEKETGAGLVFDKNSMYPSKMKYERLPIGTPIFFKGKYVHDSVYDLYVQTFSCSFELKEGKIPTIQLKDYYYFIPNEYVKTSNGLPITLTLTSIDLKLFFDNYNVEDLKFIGGWKFKSIKGLFNKYIDYWTERKISAKKEQNKALYTISKLMLNSLYGRFGLNPNVQGKYPYLNSEGVVKYALYEKETRNPVYLPVATFVTAYARYDIIKSSEAIREYSLKKYGYDCYVYS